MLNLSLPRALPFVCLCAFTPALLLAQTTTPAPAAPTATAPATPAAAPPPPPAPIVKGFNLTLTSSSQHSSGSGWASTLAPDLSFRYNKHLSGDFSFPYYTYLDTTLASGTTLHPTAVLTTVHNVIGDASIPLHLDLPRANFDYNLTVSGGFPIGDTTYSLSADEYTYNVNNHVERGMGPITPEIELGIGDASNLMKHRVLRSEIVVGPLAHFQAGASVDLPFGLNFSFDAYEELPLEDQNHYTKVLVGKRKIKETILSGSGPAEDNGLETSLDIPLRPHWTLSGFYSRDLRAQEDTAGFSIAYVLRLPKHAPKPAPAAAH